MLEYSIFLFFFYQKTIILDRVKFYRRKIKLKWFDSQKSHDYKKNIDR